MNLTPEDLLTKSSRIIARLIADKIFFEWENMHKNHVIDQINKYNHEMHLGITATTVFSRMIDFKIIKESQFPDYYSIK